MPMITSDSNWRNQTIGKYFAIREFTKSNTAEAQGFENKPTPGHMSNIAQLCMHVLIPIREHYGKPIEITSGYRGEELNEFIGGVDDSQHCTGQAADFVVQGVDNAEVCEFIKKKYGIWYDQLILENYERKVMNAGWIHISFLYGDKEDAHYRGANRCEILTKERGKPYQKGLVYDR